MPLDWRRYYYPGNRGGWTSSGYPYNYKFYQHRYNHINPLKNKTFGFVRSLHPRIRGRLLSAAQRAKDRIKTHSELKKRGKKRRFNPPRLNVSSR